MSRKGSVTSTKGNALSTEGWTCKVCSVKFTEDKAEVLECEYCEKHFCRSCVKLSSTEYKLLTKRSDLHWYCPPCEEKARKNLKIEKEVEERWNKYFSKYEKRLDEMENKLDKKVELDEVKALIQENKESAATGGNDQDGTMTSQLEEFKESMARKSNIIIFRAEESKKTEPKERKVEDIAIVNELCKITGTNKQTVKNVTRLGKKDVDSDNPRPMRVIFEDEKAKGSLMANMKNLATAEDKFKQLSITHDMTKKERLQNKEKLAEAKNKNEVLEEDNQSVNYKYLVKGSPGDRRVVKVKKKGVRRS